MNLRQTEFELSAAMVSQLPPAVCPEFVFAGRSNVGKSSLINKLCERKNLARVSSQPGKTATINFYDCVEAKLVDLPGYGFAKVSKADKARWGGLIEGYFAQERDIRLVISLIDARHAPTPDDLLMLDFLSQTGRETVVALTKIDKLNKSERSARLAAFPGEIGADVELIPFSSVTGEGCERLRGILTELAE